VSRKVSVVVVAGAVKPATAVFALDRVTAGVPATCAHEKPVAFSDAEPSSWTCWPCCTVRAARPPRGPRRPPLRDARIHDVGASGARDRRRVAG
jgi:hypothetical protein